MYGAIKATSFPDRTMPGLILFTRQINKGSTELTNFSFRTFLEVTFVLTIFSINETVYLVRTTGL